MPLATKMGFEFTFEHKTMNTASKLQKWGEHKCKPNCLGWYIEGSGQLEINSPVFTEEDAVIKYYNYLRKYLGKDFIPKRDDSTGGGCHIHANVKDHHHVKRIMAVMYNRPYLSWALNDPQDNFNAEPLTGSCDWRACCHDAGEQLKGGKTVEFRMFDNPKNTTELRMFMRIVNYIYFLARKEEPYRRLLGNSPKKQILATGVEEFNAFKTKAGITFSNQRLLDRIALETK